MDEFFGSAYTIWTVLGVLLLIAEIMTGTFFLLAFGAGCFVAAGLAWLTDASISAQLMANLVGSAIAFAVIKKWRKAQPATEYSPDAGNVVSVADWDDQKLGSTEYRGVTWTVKSLDAEPKAGRHTIVEVKNNLIEVKRLV